MEIPIYQIDAFADTLFAGNPAAVCPLEEWLPDAVMQDIAAENNLSETAFCVPKGEEFELRWFTPVGEVDLCGHATLATAYALLKYGYADANPLVFHSASGPLRVSAEGDYLELDFPVTGRKQVDDIAAISEALEVEPLEVYEDRDFMAVYPDEASVAGLTPDFRKLKALGKRGIIVTAPGDEVDFVSRFFAPAYGIDEDPVTGSVHCMLTPYWSEKLGKDELSARQISQRGGALRCRLEGDRVHIAGKAVPYLEGIIQI